MSKIMFRQDPGFLKQTLTLDEDKLNICTSAFGKSQERILALRDISLNFQSSKHRFHHLYIGPLVVMVGFIFLAWKLQFQTEILQALAIVPAIWGLLLSWYVFNGMRTIKSIRFMGKNGKFLFEIYEPRKGVALYDDFLAALTSRIQAVQRPDKPK